MMQNWTRWQYVATLVAGVYAALSPIWTETDTTATWTMVVLGVATAVVSLWAIARPEDAVAEYALALIGVLFLVSPWVMGFSDLNRLALTAWIVGAVTALIGLTGMPQVAQRMHHGPIAH